MTARDRIIIVLVLAVAAIAGAWLLVVQPKRDQAAGLDGQIAAQQSQLSTARQQLAQSQAARSAFANEYSEMVRLGEAVPADDNVPSLIYEVQSAAGAAHVDFRGLQVTASSSSSGTSSPSSSASASTPASASSPARASSSTSSTTGQLPPGVTAGPAGFDVEQFTFTLQGNFFHLSDFFNRLQQFVTASGNQVSVKGRLMTLNAINLAAGPSGFPQIAATVSATAYMLPAAQGLTAGATPLGPATSAPGAQSTSSPIPGAPAAITSPVR